MAFVTPSNSVSSTFLFSSSNQSSFTCVDSLRRPALRRQVVPCKVKSTRTNINATGTKSTASSPAANTGGPVRSKEADTPQKQFLELFKQLGRVRIVVRNPVGILETVGSFDSLFYASIPSGEYANLIDHNLNLDMHILLSGFTGARFEIGKSRGSPPAPTYCVRLFGPDRDAVAVSVFVMWDKKPDDVEAHRIDAWKALRADYAKTKTGTADGDEADTFYFDELE